MTYNITLEDIRAARTRIAPYVRHTPLAPAPMLHTDVPGSLRLKLENLQVSGSFKARGAFNNLLQANPEQRERGVIVASGGNHGLAIAYAATRLGVPSTVYLPETASADRAERIAACGATVLRYGDNPSVTLAYAADRATAEGRLNIHPFDATGTLHGTGTLGLEILDDVPDLDCILIAIGGGESQAWQQRSSRSGQKFGLSASSRSVRPR